MYLIPKDKCIANIEHFTTGKGKNNPKYTCLANARKHLRHHEMLEAWAAAKTREEMVIAMTYLVKHNVVNSVEFVLDNV